MLELFANLLFGGIMYAWITLWYTKHFEKPKTVKKQYNYAPNIVDWTIYCWRQRKSNNILPE